MGSEFRADLHCHTFYSDGGLSPQALIDHALEVGLSGLSITDHDTVAAYGEAVPYAEKVGLPLVSGVEFSAALGEEPVHILGYAFRLASAEVAELCARHKVRREGRNREILEKLRGLGIVIEEKELKALEVSTVGRPHIALLMQKKGVVRSVKEAFGKYLGEGKEAYAPGPRVSVEETLEVIHRAGGLGVVAHPHLLQRKVTVRALLEMPFDGIEGYYARFGPADEQKWVERAEARGWLVTGGSDFHGEVKPHNPLGASWVGRETFEVLNDHFRRANRAV